MNAAEIRRRFLDFFIARGHTEVPSSSLVPADDPTLLFTNAGMVQFKRTFLGQDPRPYVRATSCQKCVRAGGKHNDLEQVGTTKRHGTFFEMLGNFSFGDYFKRDAIAFAWEFVTGADWLHFSPDQLRVTVLHSDDEARALWREIAGLPDERIYSLTEADNFWQMGDTGPCGPCTEIFVDLAWKPGDAVETLTREEFEALTTAERFVEIWNLVFMQFDRSKDGTLTPLPRPSVDTGSGLDRVAAVMNGDGDMFHTDLLLPLIERVAALTGVPYAGRDNSAGVSYRVLADHARSVTFLLLDGVYPSNEGRGFVLRRILRRAVRHAWLLGRREPTLAPMVETVVAIMGDAYPELREQQMRITEIVQREEENFYGTIDAGLARLDALHASGVTRIAGEDAFKLFDTFGFPIDLTQLIASEWGIDVDLPGFERAMSEQRARSRAARAGIGVDATTQSGLVAGMGPYAPTEGQTFVGYDRTSVETQFLGGGADSATGRAEMLLRDNPFYPGGGGQVPDVGTVTGDGWTLRVDDVQKDELKRAVLRGTIEGEWPDRFSTVHAQVDQQRRGDIERNHSATHLLHMELRKALGPHVRQQGSVVEPGRLRFDFSHHAPIDPSQLRDIESAVNEQALANAMVDIREMPLQEALRLGAMAFFADKYGDVVRVVQIGDSIELCGGTHVRSAAQVGLVRLAGQSGVAAGVRRIEAVTGHQAYSGVIAIDERLGQLAETLRAQPDQVQRRVAALLAERDQLEARIAELIKTGGPAAATRFDAGSVALYLMPAHTDDRAELGRLADEFRADKQRDAVLMLYHAAAPRALSIAVTDDLIARGKDANSLMQAVSQKFGGRGGGRKAFASGSLAEGNAEALARSELPALVRDWAAA